MRKFIIALLSFQLAFFSPFASAYFDIEKYKKNSNVKAGANSAFGYSITKTATGQPELWSGLKRTAKPSAMAKLYKNFGPTLAFGAAVTAILGAVDWVMDPDNNRVIYTPEAEPVSIRVKHYAGNIGGEIRSDYDYLALRQEIDDFYLAYDFESDDGRLTDDEYESIAGNMPDCTTKDVGSYRILYRSNSSTRLQQPLIRVYVESPCAQDPEEKYLGFEEIGEKVIDNATAGDTDASNDTHKANDPETWAGQVDPNGDPEPELTKNAKPFPCSVKEGAPNSCFDEKIDDPDSETTNKPDDSGDPEPAAKVELPAFCDWAAPACNFFVNSLTSSRAFFADAKSYFAEVTAAIDETKTIEEMDTQFKEAETLEPEPEPELPIVTPITFSTPSACPANPKINFSLGRVNSQIDIPVHLACYVLELIRPFVIAGGYLTGAAILFKGRDS